MIIKKDGKDMFINPILWNEEVRIFSGAKEVSLPSTVFICKGVISKKSHCDKLMDAVALCKAEGIITGILLTDSNCNSKILKECADNSDIKDCVFLNDIDVIDYKVADEIHLPSKTMSGYYFVNADRICKDNASELSEIMIACIEEGK